MIHIYLQSNTYQKGIYCDEKHIITENNEEVSYI